jgi:hypothetical protein
MRQAKTKAEIPICEDQSLARKLIAWESVGCKEKIKKIT